MQSIPTANDFLHARTRRDGWTRGFTLIELLVVIAIIAVLAGLTMTAYQRSLRSSRAVECMSNLRQIGAALTKYMTENDGAFPTLVMARPSTADSSPALDTELASYISDARVFSCPEDYKRIAVATGTSYLWNTKLNGQRLGSLSISFMGLDPLEEPSRIMVMGDKEGFHPYLDNKVNVLYADGHASKELTFVP
jgi:prepilin-type N-terminal cleavage/methylation domain-containing protein/prepilin-type processing-associated H-X9-DG protein